MAHSHPTPSLAQLRKAREEFNASEPRGFFYWSVTKLVASVLDTNEMTASTLDDLVRALMMLLTTWNKNFYRFFGRRKPGMTLDEHFDEVEKVIAKHFDRLMQLRMLRMDKELDLPEREIVPIFADFSSALGRVGAAKCLHLLAPYYFPLWDAAILNGYGLETKEYRRRTDAERYVAFMRITKAQLDKLGDLSSFTDNPLKCLDEYNYCRFTQGIQFD